MVFLRNGKETNNIGYTEKPVKECSICFNTLKQNNCIYLNCGHRFCPCLFAWFTRDLSCPLCRKQIDGFRARLSTPLNIEQDQKQQTKQHLKMLVASFFSIFFITHANRLEHIDHVLHFGINLVLVIVVAEFVRILKLIC